jgi:alpha-glucosidase (family GH31 glycosyl hydrolase)
MVMLLGGCLAGGHQLAWGQDRDALLRVGDLRLDLGISDGRVYLAAPGLDWIPFEILRPADPGILPDYQVRERTLLSTVIKVSHHGKPCGQIRVTAVTSSAVRIVVTSRCDDGVTVRWFPKPTEELFGLFEDRGEPLLSLRGISAPLVNSKAPVTTQAANARAPFLFSQRGYALYVESEENGRFFVQSEHGSGFSYPGNQLSFVVFFGSTPSDLLRQYSRFGGSGVVPPDWALGPIWWRDDAGDLLRGRKNDQENILQDLKYFRDNRLPISAVLIDRPFGSGVRGWGDFDFDVARYPDFGKVLARLRRDQIALMVWVANRAVGNSYELGKKRGWLFPGDEAEWPAIDLRNHDAAHWFQGRLSSFAHVGVQGFKIDRGDEGEHPDTVANRLSVLMARTAQRAFAARGRPNPFLLARSAFDRSRESVAVWSGDPKGTFDGLRRSVVHGLRSAMIGFPIWGSDTGGYSGRPNEELFLRWIQFSTFSPIMEILMDHGDILYPYDLSAKGHEILRQYLSVREAMRPALKRAIIRGYETGVPPMRPLFFDYIDDGHAIRVNDQYLFGSDLLVAPMLEAGTSRRVYLPRGEWIRLKSADCSDGERYRGPVEIAVSADLSELPLFRRGRDGEKLRGDTESVGAHQCSSLFESFL